MTKKLSRRDFLKLSGTVAGATVLAACAPAATPAAPVVVKETVEVPVQQTVQVPVKETVVATDRVNLLDVCE
jgi:anaerobic selenocysteine-containing dehydrogenase